MSESAIEFLLKQQNPDGGWGAVPGRVSSTESTTFAILALKSLRRSSLEGNIQRGIRWLGERQMSDGSWPMNGILKDGSWATALAVTALSSLPDQQAPVLKGAGWILKQKGRGLPFLASVLVRLSITKFEAELNPDLKGWSWTSGAFSWVEPTAYSLMALKKIRAMPSAPKPSGRIQEGENMLYDRMCDGGGWNYGTPSVLGEKGWPYPDITALALIALQDHREKEANRQSLQALKAMLKNVNSGLALSWSIICLALYGEETSEWKNRLEQSFRRTQFLGETKSVALSLLALGDGIRFFKI